MTFCVTMAVRPRSFFPFPSPVSIGGNTSWSRNQTDSTGCVSGLMPVVDHTRPAPSNVHHISFTPSTSTQREMEVYVTILRGREAD